VSETIDVSTTPRDLTKVGKLFQCSPMFDNKSNLKIEDLIEEDERMRNNHYRL
jgi:hypothetical protein